MSETIKEKSLVRTLAEFSLPLIASGILQQLYSWADAFIVGNIVGELGLAAVGASGVVSRLITMVLVGFTGGLTVLAAQLFLLILCQNAGALFTASIPVAFLFVLEKRLGIRGRFQWGIIYTAGSIGFLIAAMTILPLFEPFFNSIGKDATLSNRTLIWEGILEYVQQFNTFTGSGFNMFWRDEIALQNLQNCYSRDSWFRSMTFGSHNVLLEMWLDMGLIGLVIYLITLIIAFVNVKKIPEEHYAVCTAIIMVLLIRGLTERAYTPSSYGTMFLFLMLGLAQQGKEIAYAAMPKGAELRSARLKQGKAKRTRKIAQRNKRT